MIILLMFLSFNSFTQDSEEEGIKKIFSYSKAPKSLFLIKKAKIGASVGEPTLSFSDLQKKSIAQDERLEYQP